MPVAATASCVPPVAHVRHRSVRPSRLRRFRIAVLCAVGASCTASPPSEHVEKAVTSPLQPAATASVRYLYPSSDRLLAEGEAQNEWPVGKWTFYYPDGQLMAQGEYSRLGAFVGPWWMWSADGRLSDLRERLGCTNGRLGMQPAGRELLHEVLSPDEVSGRLRDALPFYCDGWNGAGVYRHGIWMRELTESEASAGGRRK